MAAIKFHSIPSSIGAIHILSVAVDRREGIILGSRRRILFQSPASGCGMDDLIYSLMVEPQIYPAPLGIDKRIILLLLAEI